MHTVMFASADLLDAVEVVKQYGPFCGLLVLAVVFFMWRDYKREQRLTKRIETLENETKTILIALVETTNVVLGRNIAVMERLEKHLTN